MEADAVAYYQHLAADYSLLIRQLVPRYDELVAEIVRRLQAFAPRHVLDVGCGPGEVTARVADALPEADISAVEATLAMVEAARRRLAPYGDRTQVLHMDAMDLVLPRPIEGAFSNLVLHNLGGGDKIRALKAIRRAMATRGVFLWGDLVRHGDPDREAPARGAGPHTAISTDPTVVAPPPGMRSGPCGGAAPGSEETPHPQEITVTSQSREHGIRVKLRVGGRNLAGKGMRDENSKDPVRSWGHCGNVGKAGKRGQERWRGGNPG